MKKKTTVKSSGTQQSQLDRRASNIAALFRLKSPSRFAELYRLRSQSSATKLFQTFPKIFPSRDHWEQIHGLAFPTRLSEMFSRQAIGAPAGPLSEIIWAICRCVQYGDELAAFVEKRVEFEESLVRDSGSSCKEILDEIEGRWGCSMWLTQNRLSTVQLWDGLDAARKLLRSFEDQAGENWLASLLLRFTSKRIEATGLKNYLKTELSKVLDPEKYPDIEKYVRAKLFDLADIDVDDVAATLFFEAQACIVDYYETLILVLQCAASNDAIPSDVAPVLATPLAALYKRTKDTRLEGVMRGVGLAATIGPVIDPERAKIVEAYSDGRYTEVISLGYEWLQANPADGAMLVLLVKACFQSGSPIPSFPGLVGDVSNNLHKVLSLSAEDAFAAAYALITLAEKFYGHTWVLYIRAVVLYELREEQLEYPPVWLRDIYVRDRHITPFTAVGATGEAKRQVLGLGAMAERFPSTLSIYRVVTSGEPSPESSGQDPRRRAYFARYHLTKGDAGTALKQFKSLMLEAQGAERARCAGGAALAALKMKDTAQAIDLIVSAFLENPHATSVLPVKAVVNTLDDPAHWPEQMSLPLILELYASTVNAEKLSHLRYAFERFQLAHKISQPNDLLQMDSVWGRDAVVAYLDRVWRPEIMRQTILYQGTKEIEEARIRVCRLLAELDPSRSVKYLDEIKNRVKQQEIAKGASLVQQSKVYVDIEAIRKTLRSRLSDTYSRYKSSTATSSPKTDSTLLHQITDALADQAAAANISIPKILSGLHIIGDSDTAETSESDAQFAALFGEVTKEFLNGDHGLNAYLSTRVRHGTLSNTLRKPVADEKLVTPLKEGSDFYLPNKYWFAQAADGERYRPILMGLDRFSREFDRVISHVNDALIQIKIDLDLKDMGRPTEALFVYRSSNLERRFMQEYDRTSRDIDDLINRCVDTLWEKTDENLASVQKVLEAEVRTKLMTAFDKLADEVNGFGTLPGVPDLLNAIAQARTATNAKLNMVISWFKRSEVYDRQDYAPDLPVDIAMNMITSTISSASDWSSLTVQTAPAYGLMPGRTLDGLVDVFYGLIENAIKHSGLDAQSLWVRMDISFTEGCYSADVVNNLRPGRPTPADREKVDRLREALGRSDSRRKAQLEGGSGLHKIWRAVNSPLYKEPSLTFSLSPPDAEVGLFSVKIKFNLERGTDEDSPS
jgi:hypothetical protein